MAGWGEDAADRDEIHQTKDIKINVEDWPIGLFKNFLACSWIILKTLLSAISLRGLE